jgi:hypothetical protein
MRDKRLAARKIDGIYYLISPWDHKLHKLNETASCIAELLDKGLSEKQIVQKIAEQYDVTQTAAEKDVKEFVAVLEEKELYQKA